MFMKYKNMVPYPGHLNSQTTKSQLGRTFPFLVKKWL